MITSDSPFSSRRRQDVLSRVRQRQALRRPLTTDEILSEEQRIFAEDEKYVPQLLQAYALLQGSTIPEVKMSNFSISEPAPVFVPPSPLTTPHVAQRDHILEPPPADKELTEFDRQHNALRLYVIQQYQEGKKSREIGLMIGMTPHKLTRWYNQVKDLPPAMHLWIPLLKEEEVGQSKPSTAEESDVVVEPISTMKPVAARVVEPSREAVKAAKRSLLQAEKNALIERDREYARTWIAANTAAADDSATASRLCAFALHREEWSLSRIGRALTLDVSTISRWMARARQAEQDALVQKIELSQVHVEQKPKVEPEKAPVRRPQPRPKMELPRPTVPLSAMAKRSVGMLQALLECAETDALGCLRLQVATATERERILAVLSMLDIQPSRPQARSGGFMIPLPAEEANFLKRTLAQG